MSTETDARLSDTLHPTDPEPDQDDEVTGRPLLTVLQETLDRLDASASQAALSAGLSGDDLNLLQYKADLPRHVRRVLRERQSVQLALRSLEKTRFASAMVQVKSDGELA